MRPSRLIALVSSVLLTALVLVTSGFACESNSGVAMAGMQMGGHATDVPQQNTPSPQTPPCRFPWAPDGCQSMIPCAPAAVETEAVRVDVPHSSNGAAVTMVAIAPPSETLPPELPPPRA